ncbi:MAG: hypothetical protein A3K83_07820 [Omnitrophica WOR_2 bacterium RBG_13_44_8b]|nr:MAG: hypothetical protein A3K83_07820 [Omnitrophica WOR_2 bacterium RBG_13_44_8b]
MHNSYCLTCGTQNCFNRKLGPKKKNCLELDYKKEIQLNGKEKELIRKANQATHAAFQKKIHDNFATNWLVGFIRNYFGNNITIGIACCLGALEKIRDIIKIFETAGIKTNLVTCKLGGLTTDAVNKEGKPYRHPGCNPIAQAKILNKLNVPVVVLVSLCIGYDMIFIKHCKPYVIPFITKMPMGYGLA